MQAGKLRHRVSLQQPGTTQDDIGQPIVSWTEVAKVWADIRYLSGTEAIRSDAAVSIGRASIQIRKRAGVLATMRVVDAAGVVYKINAVLPDMVNRDCINLPCEVVS